MQYIPTKFTELQGLDGHLMFFFFFLVCVHLPQVRLDSWHFMRRLAVGCTTESHPLYGTFMARLSACIFEWDGSDVAALMAAKKVELRADGLRGISDDAVRQALSRDELVRHCRRVTRGAQKTIKLIEELLLSLTTATDTLGVRLFNDQMASIWEEEKRHVSCLQVGFSC